MVFLSIARMRQDAVRQARARMATIGERWPGSIRRAKGIEERSIVLRGYVVDPQIRLGMFVLLGGAGLVLLIAWVSLADLLLAQEADRRAEWRSARLRSKPPPARPTDADRKPRVRSPVESRPLLASWLVEELKAAATMSLPMLQTLRIDGTAAGAAASIASATAVSRVAPGPRSVGLSFSGRAARGGPRPRRWTSHGRLQDVLVVAQIALAIVLLVGAGLMLRGFVHLTHVDPGVDVDRLLVGRVALPNARRPTGSGSVV